jgi:hypothetical protein
MGYSSNMRTPWLVRLLPLTLLPACTITIGDDADDEIGETVDEGTDASDATSESTDTGDATSEGTDTGDATSESTDDATDATDESTDDATDTDTTDTGDEVCQPGPESPAHFSYVLDIPGVDAWDADITWSCTLLSHDTVDGLTLALDCPDANGPVSIEVFADPMLNPPLMDGSAITLRYVSEGPWWFNSYLRIDMDGFGHLFTLIDGDSLQPPEPYVFELPFPITTVSGLCDPMPDGCGDRERLGLSFSLGGEDIVMFDLYYAIVGGDPGTDIWIDEAYHLHDVQCTDTPDEWFRVLIANTGWE